jgi:hypothetical protein
VTCLRLHRTIVFAAFVTASADESLDTLVKAAAGFSAAIRQQLEGEAIKNGLCQEAILLVAQVNSSTMQLAAEVARFSK